jgi:hypothetical protein
MKTGFCTTSFLLKPIDKKTNAISMRNMANNFGE